MYFGTYNRLNVAVSATDREVIRALVKRMIPYQTAHREARREVFKAILECHRNARDLANFVG